VKTEIPDVNETLEYRPGAAMMDPVPNALGLCLFALFMLTLDDEPPVGIAAASGVVLTAGIGWIAFALYRRSNPGRTLFVLSPAGILYPIYRAKAALIPWHEIENVDTIDIATRNWAAIYSYLAPKLRYRDVTVVLVSRRFYDSHFFSDSLRFRFGPPWETFFIPKGSSVQIALHHQPLTVEPRVLRGAVEARWHAFRDRPPGSASLPTQHGKSIEPPGTTVLMVSAVGQNDTAARPGRTTIGGTAPRRMSTWQAVKLIVPSIGIAIVLANLFGLWATPGQIASRREREKRAEERRLWNEEQRQLQETQRATEERIQELLRGMH
jgi:hypothetical protein